MIGFRAFFYHEENFVSPQQGAVWENLSLKAICPKGCKEIPSFGKWDVPEGEKCWCGIHASQWIETAATYVPRYSTDILIGVVEGFGRIIQHELGFRAEEMDIIGLVDLNPARLYHQEHIYWEDTDEKNIHRLMQEIMFQAGVDTKRILLGAMDPKDRLVKYQTNELDRIEKFNKGNKQERLKILTESTAKRTVLLKILSTKLELPYYTEEQAVRLIGEWLDAEGNREAMDLAIREGDNNKEDIGVQNETRPAPWDKELINVGFHS